MAKVLRNGQIIEVPDSEFPPPPPPTIAMVKQEAARRILVICPKWKQRNLTARAAELAIKGVANWTAEEQAEHAAGQAIWEQIKMVRTKSGELEVMTPIPVDYTDDKYWM